MTNQSWKLQGLCKKYDPELFFRPDEKRKSVQTLYQERYAKSICSGCPVSGNCLDEALDKGEIGIWGGTTIEDRRALRRRGSRVYCNRCGSKDKAQTDEGQICLRCGLSWLL